MRRVVENSDDLVAMLQRRYTGTNPHFLWNREFVSTVRECQQHILNNKDKSYVYLAQFNKTLKVIVLILWYRNLVTFHLCLVMIFSKLSLAN